MKKLMIFFALVLGSTVIYAQRGYNSGAQQGRNGYTQTTHHSQSYDRGQNRGQSRNVGYNRGAVNNRGYGRTTTRHYQGRGNGTYYRGGVTTNRGVRAQTRVRWRNSRCGTFRTRLTQERRCNPGYWTNNRGCRRWVEPTYTWHTVCSERVYRYNGCGW